jgi:hypothetical protein
MHGSLAPEVSITRQRAVFEATERKAPENTDPRLIGLGRNVTDSGSAAREEARPTNEAAAPACEAAANPNSWHAGSK